ncbi:MAG: sensory rhodopsin transducer [Candidatus Poribacteria bacterium]|nr:sensory rhodopsin transducer [Candidatus Poribacteria bacterium]
MTFETLMKTINNYGEAGLVDLNTLTALLNNAFGDWLASQGISRVDMVAPRYLWFTVQGELKQTHAVPGIKLYDRFFVVDRREIHENPKAIADALTYYSSDGDGAYVWIVPDGYMAALTPAEQGWEAHGGGYFSHESICISNTADRGTCCLLEVLYEDPALKNVSCEFEVPAHRSVHYRLDMLKTENGDPLIAKDAPVSYKITSRDTRVVVQGSRILTSGENSTFASFGTVMAWCPQ